jgi:hypothetical protein
MQQWLPEERQVQARVLSGVALLAGSLPALVAHGALKQSREGLLQVQQ